jgi:lipoprotein-releasing system ATP-binding protein
MSNVITLQKITKTFSQAHGHLDILKGISLSLKPGEIVGLLGSSGSGKSTLLHIMGLLEKPTGGALDIGGQATAPLNETQRSALRRHKIGFVYQAHHLLPEFTALENVMMPLIIQGVSMTEAHTKAMDYLAMVGLRLRAQHRPSRLSGGEQQRVAILRALVTNPAILLADEPTGNLDNDTSNVVFEELITLVRRHKIAALIATHDVALAQKMDRVLKLEHGVLR